MMEMYADETARAGVLEPEGIVEIKLRKDKLLAMMDRLDPTYHALKVKSTDASLSATDATAAKADLATREKILYPLYSQVALQIADSHDRKSFRFAPRFQCLLTCSFRSFRRWSHEGKGYDFSQSRLGRVSSVRL